MHEKNIVFLKGMNTDAMLEAWVGDVKVVDFNPLSKNCSAIAKELLLAGAGIERKKLHCDRVWQMPKNTKKLALEIQQLRDLKSDA